MKQNFVLSLFFSALQVLKHEGVKSVPTLGSSGLFAFDDL